MAKQDNIAAQEHLAENINSGDIDAALESFAEDCVDHDPAPDQEAGREGFRTFFTALKKGFPDGVQVARFEDGKIVERWGASDELGILRQLGAAPEAAG